MKSVLISIKPKWCELIASGKKTIEIRKTKPRTDTPFKCYIYCTKHSREHLVRMPDGSHRIYDGWNYGKSCTMLHFKGECNSKVIGEFICSEITEFESEFWDDETYERIQTIIKDSEHYAEYGEYEYETVATNEDAKYKENWLCEQSCVSWEEMRKYVGAGIEEFYGWHISNLKIYDKPKELSEFYTRCRMNCELCKMWGHTRVNADEFDMDCKSDWVNHKPILRPPQSWCYVEEAQE